MKMVVVDLAEVVGALRGILESRVIDLQLKKLDENLSNARTPEPPPRRTPPATK